MNERGFVLPALPMMAWGAIAAGVVIAGLGIALKIQSARLETSKAETVAVQAAFDLFKQEVKLLGEQQAEKAKAQDLLNAQFKEKANVELAKSKTELSGLYAAYRKLRQQGSHTYSSPLPAASATAASPALATFDREVLDRGLAIADGILQEGAEKILQRGDTAIVELNVSKRWAQKLSYTMEAPK